MRSLLALLLTVLTATLAAAPAALAQEPVPPCREIRPCWGPQGPAARLEHLQVDLTVTDGAVRARYELRLSNPGDFPAEGRIVFPVPAGSSVTDLLLSGGPQTLEGRLLGAEDAGRIYEEIVRRSVDPALLRSLGDRLFEVRAFPVPPGEERSVSFDVTAPLTVADGQAVIEIPWSRMSPRPAAAAVTADVDVSWEVRGLLSPGHRLSTERSSDGRLSLSWESAGERDLAADFRLYLTGGEGLLDTHLLAYRTGQGDGYFALLFTPALDVSERVDRDVVFVIDTSGSMEGEKLSQAKRALAYVLERLGEDDRFAIIAFSRTIRVFGDGLQAASARDGALDFIEGLEAAGSTNISGALDEAFALIPGSRPATVIFLTDGLPTAGLKDSAAILALARTAAPERTQLFAFGVGDDVDTLLLDGLAEELVGNSYYVGDDEQIDAEVGRLFERISTPILTDVEVEVEGGGVYAVAPAGIRGLFAGSQTLLTGRYASPGSLHVEVSGNGARGQERFSYDLTLPERETSDPTVAQLWAQRRVADLLTELRLEGPRRSLVEEIVEIATQFGIVTPYTSYLAEEPDLVLDGAGRAARSVADAAAAPASGAYAVAGAGALEALREGDYRGSSDRLQVVGARSFFLVDGTWVESGYERARPAPEVAVGSKEFADLLESDPEIAAAASIGERVVARSEDSWVTLVWPAAAAGEDEIAVPELPEPAVMPGTAPDPDPGPALPDSDEGAGGGALLPLAGGLLTALLVTGLATVLVRSGRRRRTGVA